MGLQILCPRCGSRAYTEFTFGGEVRVGETDSPDGDFARVWLRRNVAGIQTERWYHDAGCRRWMTVERDTLTNEIHAVH